MRLRSIVVLLLLGLAGGASTATAAESHARAAHRGSGATVQEPLGLFGQLGVYLVALWDDAGCRIDPLGLCSADHSEGGSPPAITSTSGKAGCIIDPWGACSANHGDSGSPSSTGASGTQALDTDEGCIINPWGCVRNR